MRKAIAVHHHERTVYGQFCTPEGEGPFPAVLLSHGYNGCMTDFSVTAEYLASRGIASAAYTFCGGSTRDESGFPSTQMTLFTERDDLLAMLQWLKDQPCVNAQRICLFGGSMGGLVSVLAAHEQPEDVAGLALLFPALCVADNWNQRFPSVSDIPETVELWDMPLGRGFFTSIRELDVFKLLPSLSQPTLILHGDEDCIVPLSYSRRAAETFPNASLHVFSGEGHGFPPEASRRADGLLAEHILDI